jgi:hypothetical protein
MCRKTKIKLFRLLVEFTTAAMFVTLVGRAIPFK